MGEWMDRTVDLHLVTGRNSIVTSLQQILESNTENSLK